VCRLEILGRKRFRWWKNTVHELDQDVFHSWGLVRARDMVSGGSPLINIGAGDKETVTKNLE